MKSLPPWSAAALESLEEVVVRESQIHLDSHFDPEAELHIVFRFAFAPLTFELFDQLQHSESRRENSRRLLLVEDRPELLHLAFHLKEWQPLIESERCLWVVDRPQNNALARLLQRYPDISQCTFFIYCGDPGCPTEQLSEWQKYITQFQQATCRELSRLLQQHIVHSLPPFPKTIRFFTAGHNIFQDACVQALQGMGYDAQRLQWKSPLYRFVRTTAWTREYVASHLDTAVFLNTTPRLFTQSSDLNDLPMNRISWFVDNPLRYIHKPSDTVGCDLIAVFDPAYIPFLRAHSKTPVIELRTGYGIHAGMADHKHEYENIDIAFVGELGARSRKPLEELFRRDIPNFDAISENALASFNLTQPGFMPARVEPILQKYDVPYRGALVEYLENRATTLRRFYYLKDLADWGLVIFGDSEWGNPFYLGPLSKCYAGRRLPYATELPSLYAGAKININIFHTQCVGAPNPRVYDVLACGGFLLTTPNAGLADEFEVGRDLVVFHSPKELRELAHYYLAHPKEREEIARRGQERALAKCGYHDRMQTLLTALNQNRGESYAYLCR